MGPTLHRGSEQWKCFECAEPFCVQKRDCARKHCEGSSASEEVHRGAGRLKDGLGGFATADPHRYHQTYAFWPHATHCAAEAMRPTRPMGSVRSIRQTSWYSRATSRPFTASW